MELLPILNLNYNFTLTFFHFTFYPYYLEMKAPFISIPNKIIKEIIQKDKYTSHPLSLLLEPDGVKPLSSSVFSRVWRPVPSGGGCGGLMSRPDFYDVRENCQA